VPVFVAVVTELQIKVEEQALRGVFGDAYQAYLQEVPGWVGRTRRTR
jgi:protein-S-isoprenylcysteine O-methyltransferase Ste14